MARFSVFLLILLFSLAATAQKPWKDSPHGPMLERIIPPGYTAAMLPEPKSQGARLTLRYCVQCHNLANPSMHDAERWTLVVRRMVPRMEGKGNMGKLMTEMMAGVEAPSLEDERIIAAYHRKHAQRPLDPKLLAEVSSSSGEAFRVACSQCHVLPDPRRHRAAQWPEVVARMQKNMEWMNRVVGSKPIPGEPQLRIEDINAFLMRHARR